MYVLPLVLILLQCNCNLLELHRRHGIKEYKWQLAILVLYKSLPEKYYLRFYNRFCMNFAYLIHIYLVYRLKNVVAKYFKNLHDAVYNIRTCQSPTKEKSVGITME